MGNIAMSKDSTVVEREREFHNARFAQDVDPRTHLGKWYQTLRHGAEKIDSLVISLSTGKDVLEYGCSDGQLSLVKLGLGDKVKSLKGIDISDVAIEKANGLAKDLGLHNAEFFAMDAQAMTFADASFDVVFGRAIIHHLDLDRCYSEIRRVLRPGGTAIFYEPMGHNPLLNAYRNRTPDIRTEDEHPLLVQDFDLARKYFSKVDVEYFGLATVASALVGSALREPVFKLGQAIDSVALKVPFVNKYAWYAIMVMTR